MQVGACIFTSSLSQVTLPRVVWQWHVLKGLGYKLDLRLLHVRWRPPVLSCDLYNLPVARVGNRAELLNYRIDLIDDAVVWHFRRVDEVSHERHRHKWRHDGSYQSNMLKGIAFHDSDGRQRRAMTQRQISSSVVTSTTIHTTVSPPWRDILLNLPISWQCLTRCHNGSRPVASVINRHSAFAACWTCCRWGHADYTVH